MPADERIRGRASFAVDPEAPANAAIADLALAPRDAQGLVHFRADFLMLRPADAARGSGALIYEVNNRGTLLPIAPVRRDLWDQSRKERVSREAKGRDTFRWRRLGDRTGASTG
jgi:hypothetical protein